MKNIVALVILFICLFVSVQCRYEPTWQSLDSRPLPQWYDDSKIGIFIHWGLYSVPSFRSEWFWQYWHSNSTDCVEFMRENYKPDFTYADFASEFTASFFNASEWVDIFKSAGAKYIVMGSKHHEGFTMWPSKYKFNWNSYDVGPKRDIIGELSSAVRNESSIHFGIYHSLYEWFNPFYLSDKATNFTKTEFSKITMGELHELVDNYQPEVIWSDGEWDASTEYWTSKEFIAYLYNDSPMKENIVVNDRWGHQTLCHHGDFYTCTDRYNPGKLMNHKWENCFTLDARSWGYRRRLNIQDVLSETEVINELVSTVSCGGNVLINVGPTKDGKIIPIFQERLSQVGNWLKINGEAIYKTRPWIYQNDTLTKDVWYTKKDKKVYAIITNSWRGEEIELGALTGEEIKKITFLTSHGEIVLDFHSIPSHHYSDKLLSMKHIDQKKLKEFMEDNSERVKISFKNVPVEAILESRVAWTLIVYL